VARGVSSKPCPTEGPALLIPLSSDGYLTSAGHHEPPHRLNSPHLYSWACLLGIVFRPAVAISDRRLVEKIPHELFCKAPGERRSKFWPSSLDGYAACSSGNRALMSSVNVPYGFTCAHSKGVKDLQGSTLVTNSWLFVTFDTAGEVATGYAAELSASNRANGVRRVFTRAVSRNHSLRRSTFSPTAVRMCPRRTRARPR
jgi:hypothetical protein